MKLYSPFILLFSTSIVSVKALRELPHISEIIETAFPTWCVNSNDERIDCVDKPNGKWSPLYFTKEHSGGDPALGGYPTNIDIQYAFEYAAPFFGQACAGSPHHCNETFDGSSKNCKTCPKISSDNDTDPYGPGHVPPHIALAALTRAYKNEEGDEPSSWFDFPSSACRVVPNKLLKLIRLYYPRSSDGKAYYPPPFSDEGGAYPLEFVNLAGESCEQEKKKHPNAGKLECFEDHTGNINEFPDYLKVGHGSPHYCTKEGIEASVNPDWCPYIFFGQHRGKYRHPHIALAALETYIANIVMPSNCKTTWDDSNYPASPDTTVAFPKMKKMQGLDPGQPVIEGGKWIWPGPEGKMKKAVVGNFATNLYITTSAPTSSSAMIFSPTIIVGLLACAISSWSFVGLV